MSKLTNYLNQLQEQEIKTNDKMRCDICGREVTINKAGKGPLICCGEPMKKFASGIKEAEGFHGLPKGWNQKSMQKFGKHLTGKEGQQKGFFDKCVKKMTGKVDNPEAFCAAAKDEITGSTMWRGKGKSPQQGGKDIKAHQNVKQD